MTALILALPRLPIPALRRTLARWWHNAGSRRQLAELDDRMLADIGLDPVEARREARRPFWTGGPAG